MYWIFTVNVTNLLIFLSNAPFVGIKYIVSCRSELGRNTSIRVPCNDIKLQWFKARSYLLSNIFFRFGKCCNVPGDIISIIWIWWVLEGVCEGGISTRSFGLWCWCLFLVCSSIAYDGEESLQRFESLSWHVCSLQFSIWCCGHTLWRWSVWDQLRSRCGGDVQLLLF